MTVRPNLDEETVEEIDEKLQDVMTVDPEKVGVDEKIRVLLRELDNLTEEVEETENVNDKLDNVLSNLRSLEGKVDNPNNRF